MSIDALCPLDGRYESKVNALKACFSEVALIKARVQVEIEWFKAMSAEVGIPELREFTGFEIDTLNAIVENFDLVEAQEVKNLEATTNHDVKAVEYYIKNKLKDSSMAKELEFIHFGCTSEDINNLSHAIMLKNGVATIKNDQEEIIAFLSNFAENYKNVAILSRTHGQTASPSTIGKEFAVFANRLHRQSQQIANILLLGKMNGAVGNFNAHMSAYPDVDWVELSRKVIEDQLGLTQNLFTIQIEPHDYMAELFDAMARWNTILIDIDRDIWTYISMAYFGQKTVAGEVGSSTMPHKVNPIDFENSEGNLGLANALFSHLSAKLPISRLQRDLTDSTVLRNMGVAFGYSLLAYKSTLKGFGKLLVREDKLAEDLDNAWEVLAEPIQTVMRKAGIEEPYEKLKALTRKGGKSMSKEVMQEFIQTLDLDPKDKEYLMNLTPGTYTGIADKIVDML
ncbi:MAG: adenylosuccinate lyase [Lentisphaeria bacterium]|nr:adenylosuccinate lyase [Lentisphaeria bacterium]